MAVNLRFSIISLGVILLMVYVAETNGKPQLNDNYDQPVIAAPDNYKQHFSNFLMDAGKIIGNIIQRGKTRLMELPQDGFFNY